jgi:hypothetical protein
VAALLDSVQLALPDTSEFTIRPYRPRYSADLVSRPQIGYVRDNFGRGVYGGAAVQFTDLLGDHAITIAGAVNGRIEEAQVFAAYANVARRLNWAVGLSQDVSYYYLQTEVGQDTSTGELFANQRLLRWTARQIFAQALFPISRFNRFEGRFSVYNLEQATRNQFYFFDPTGTFLTRYDQNITILNSQVFVMPSIAYVHDNSLFGWTSPFLGSRYRFEVGQAVGGIQFARAVADWRRYTSLAGPFTLATRVTSFGSFGRDEDRFPIFIGTPDRVHGYTYGSLLNNECSASADCSQLDQLIGSRMALAGAELRFPLLRAALGFAPIGLPPIEGAFFYDAGLAWRRGSILKLRRDPSDPSDIRAPVSSWGYGFRINVMGFVIVSIDYARPLSRPDYRKGYWIVSLYPPW